MTARLPSPSKHNARPLTNSAFTLSLSSHASPNSAPFNLSFRSRVYVCDVIPSSSASLCLASLCLASDLLDLWANPRWWFPSLWTSHPTRLWEMSPLLLPRPTLVIMTRMLRTHAPSPLRPRRRLAIPMPNRSPPCKSGGGSPEPVMNVGAKRSSAMASNLARTVLSTVMVSYLICQVHRPKRAVADSPL